MSSIINTETAEIGLVRVANQPIKTNSICGFIYVLLPVNITSSPLRKPLVKSLSRSRDGVWVPSRLAAGLPLSRIDISTSQESDGKGEEERERLLKGRLQGASRVGGCETRNTKVCYEIKQVKRTAKRRDNIKYINIIKYINQCE